MKKLAFLLSIIALSSLASCSKCYDCATDVALTDANTGDTIGTTTNNEELCTADASEIDSREDEGANCTAQ